MTVEILDLISLDIYRPQQCLLERNYNRKFPVGLHKQAGTNSSIKYQIVLLEAFLVHSKGVLPALIEEPNKKIEVVRKLAREFETELIPFNDFL
jgi:hypothetical protein